MKSRFLYSLDIWYGWIAAVLIGFGLFLAAECSPTPAHAGFYLDAAGGPSFFQITAADGDYLQKGLPHSLDATSLAYRVGAGYAFTDRWAMQVNWMHLGRISQTAKFVDDRDYDPKGHQCLANCATARIYKMTDRYYGVSVTGTYTWPFEPVSVFVKGGGAYLWHDFQIARDDYLQTHTHTGEFPAVVVGLGATYRWLYVETELLQGLGSSNGFMGRKHSWPLSKEIVVAWFGIKIPLAF